MGISCLLESLLLFYLSLWSVPFAFLYYHFSGIPGGSGDNVCVHRACTGKERAGVQTPRLGSAGNCGSQASQNPPHWPVRIRSIDQSGLAPGGARQRWPMHHWNTWIFCHLGLGVGIHFVYSMCTYQLLLHPSAGQPTPGSPLLTA